MNNNQNNTLCLISVSRYIYDYIFIKINNFYKNSHISYFFFQIKNLNLLIIIFYQYKYLKYIN